MVSLGYLSPYVVTSSHLEKLLKIQTELPHDLRLPVDRTEELWKYYNALSCVTLLEGNKLLALASVPWFNRGNMLEIYQVINYPSHMHG